METAQALTENTKAASLLTSAGEGVATAVAEVRTICEGLRPPGIDDLGLPRALAALAARMESPGLVIDVRIETRLDLDPAVEVALYRIATEALANVARHSGAGRAALEVRADDRVDLLVRDDGVGLDAPGQRATAGSGLGLSSMRNARRRSAAASTSASAPTAARTSVRSCPCPWEVPT